LGVQRPMIPPIRFFALFSKAAIVQKCMSATVSLSRHPRQDDGLATEADHASPNENPRRASGCQQGFRREGWRRPCGGARQGPALCCGSFEPRGSRLHPLASQRSTTGCSDWTDYHLGQRLGTFAGSLYRDVQSPVGLCAGKFGAVTAVGIGCIKSLQAGRLANHYFSPAQGRV
jgi:hypothetical protein